MIDKVDKQRSYANYDNCDKYDKYLHGQKQTTFATIIYIGSNDAEYIIISYSYFTLELY